MERRLRWRYNPRLGQRATDDWPSRIARSASRLIVSGHRLPRARIMRESTRPRDRCCRRVQPSAAAVEDRMRHSPWFPRSPTPARFRAAPARSRQGVEQQQHPQAAVAEVLRDSRVASPAPCTHQAACCRRRGNHHGARMPSGPKVLLTKSSLRARRSPIIRRPSRPLSCSASIIPISTDLPTPDPANNPMRGRPPTRARVYRAHAHVRAAP